MNRAAIFRVLDANLNRLREGIRVVEEYYRFVLNDGEMSRKLKTLRHQIREIESGLNRDELLAGRESDHDPFRSGSEARERQRAGMNELVLANLRRSQEAARVLEEYLKLVEESPLSEQAKEIRFSLYSVEKRWGNGEPVL